ncbi:MAG: flavodoxin domain-containing protein [Bacteroidota bacterium]
MLAEERLKQLQDLINTSTEDELIWINGYLSGLVGKPAANGNGHAVNLANGNGHAIPTAVKKISLAFGTETGNAKRLATQLAAVAKKKGVNVKLVDLSQYRVADLAKEEYFFVVISTQGEGEPPLPAKKFYDHIHDNELVLSNLKYSVLALGDSSYPLFCKTGEDVDERFEQFGARKVIPLQKCDVDYEEDAAEWFEKVVAVVEAKVEQPVTTVVPATLKKAATRKHYTGTILANINLNDSGSGKQTYHIEIVTSETIEYEPGDAIGIFPKNRMDVVERIISLTGIDPGKEIDTSKITATVRELLTRHLNICHLLTSIVKKYAGLIQQGIPDTRMDLVDLLRIYPVKNAGQFEEVIKILSPIAPRLYSIASAPAAQSTEVHIIVARNRFLAQDEQRFGLCSDFLGDQPTGTPLSFYVHKNRAFRLPAPEKDIIMIGPGTGIAPMRSFLIERDTTGATGRNWLFFGEQHFITDFLYQTEIQNYVQTGVLNKVGLAFSRDQPEKIYVQHRMLEQGAELYEWINGGAYIYISGTKDPMSKDVETVLLQIIEEQGKKTNTEAKEYLERLKKNGRYEKDVY